MQDHYSQAALFFNSLTPVEQQRVIFAAIFELSHAIEGVQMAVLSNYAKVSQYLADKIAEGLGLTAPKAPEGWVHSNLKSGFLSMVEGPYVQKSPKSKTVAILAGDGYDSEQLDALLSQLKSAGVVAYVVGSRLGTLKGSTKVNRRWYVIRWLTLIQGTVKTDFALFTIKSVAFDGVFIVGGEASVRSLALMGEAVSFVNEAFRHCKPIGAAGNAIAFLQGKANFPPQIQFAENDKVMWSLLRHHLFTYLRAINNNHR